MNSYTPVLLLLAAAPLLPGADQDPPGRVARLAYLQGPVSFQEAGSDGWDAAVLNRPVTTGDRVWTDAGARVELQAGSLTVRMEERTSVEFVLLDDRTAQLRITTGTVGVRVRRLDDEENIEIDTPNAAVALLRTGDYRIDVGEDTRVIARGGQADVSFANETFVVRPRQQARIAGKYEISGAPASDEFDEFCARRDRREEQAEARKYVSPGVIGWEDLDEYGVWQSHPEYGWIWAPRVIAPGWAPYRFGHWVWIEPWGWTWIDDAPWGFAPFHYGRWLHWETRWCWIPGPPRVRAVYSPALVVFVGGGRSGFRVHWQLSVGIGVAWFPLGPHEVYVPPYRGSRNYIANINVSNTVIRNPGMIHAVRPEQQRYLNRGVGGAVTAAPEDAFKRGRAVHRSAEPVTPGQAQSGRVGGMGFPERPAPRMAEPRTGPRAPRPPEPAAKRPTLERPRPPEARPRPAEPARPRAAERPTRQQQQQQQRAEREHRRDQQQEQRGRGGKR